jgi:hypothetical protein
VFRKKCDRDVLFGSAGLCEFSMESIRRDHPLRRLFSGLVENAFCTDVGVCNPALTEYVSDLLVDFIHVERLEAARNARGKRLDQMAAMLVAMSDEQPASVAERDRSMYRHIGDYALFWAGLYPEQLRVRSSNASDVLIDYVSQGKRSYAIVSDLATEEEKPPSSLFRNLSDDFESCLLGLGLVRRAWEHGGSAIPPGGELIY